MTEREQSSSHFPCCTSRPITVQSFRPVSTGTCSIAAFRHIYIKRSMAAAQRKSRAVASRRRREVLPDARRRGDRRRQALQHQARRVGALLQFRPTPWPSRRPDTYERLRQLTRPSVSTNSVSFRAQQPKAFCRPSANLHTQIWLRSRCESSVVTGPARHSMSQVIPDRHWRWRQAFGKVPGRGGCPR